MKFIVNFYTRHKVIFNLLFLLAFLYLFLFSLELMGTSLKMFGKGFAATLIKTTTNPLVGLFIGILVTSVIQSSSSTTAIVVWMVAGGVLNIANAIPIVMGANIGTSVTCILVSMTQINRSQEFERSFSAAIVHDFFNLLAVLVLFPLQYFTNYLGIAATYLGNQFQHIGGLNFLSPIKAITTPVVTALIDLIGNQPWILLALSLFFLLFALTRMIKSLKFLIISKAEGLFDRYLFKTAPRAFLVGLLLTLLVQSSSITTSLVVPLAGAGLLTLIQIFPYTLGTNVGTTITAILAALVTGNVSAIIVAFSHLLFNISGIVLWWPFRAVPIYLAQKFAHLSTKSKLVPILYVVFVFFLLPILLITIFK